jgi:hypothetical protein
MGRGPNIDTLLEDEEGKKFGKIYFDPRNSLRWRTATTRQRLLKLR